jgi:hypothetical protein
LPGEASSHRTRASLSSSCTCSSRLSRIGLSPFSFDSHVSSVVPRWVGSHAAAISDKPESRRLSCKRTCG